MYNIERLPGVIDIGKVGEKNFRTIEFDLSSWITEIPNGVPSLVVVRPGDSEDAAYIAATTFENNILTWIVSDSDTANDGAGTIQIWLEEFSDEDVTKRGKSAMTAIRVYESIASASSNVPAPQTAWMEQMTGLKTETVAAKQAAETAQGLAETAQGAAETAQTAAEAAQVAAEAAQVDAEAAQVDAEAAQTAAEAAQTAAEAAQTASETAQGKAEEAQAAAETARDAAVAATEGKADKVIGGTTGNFAGLDADGNLVDSGHKHSDYLTQHQDITGKADKVTNATSGNFAGLDSNGNLTDSGHKHSDYLTQHQDITGKVDKNQGAGNSGKVLGIGNDGYVVPVAFEGNDFTGATASTAGTHGYVIAPSAGDQEKYLKGDGTWDNPPGTKPYTFQLDTVTNTSGSYTHTTSSQYAVASMKPMILEVSDPDVFQDEIVVTFTDGYITLECDSVAGTSDVWITAMKAITANESDPPAMTSTEFDILSNRIGSLSSLTTTAKTNLVSAVNEVDGNVATLDSKITQRVIGGYKKTGDTVPANSYANIVVSFDTTFAKAPTSVVANIAGSYTPRTELTGPSVLGITTTGFTVRVRNDYNQDLPVWIYWIAFFD